MAKFTGEAGAALVFLIGYALVFTWMLFAYLTHRIKWKSRYSLLFFHVSVRVASQACGIASGVLGFSNMNVFLAYLIMGAEGYFTLVLCAFRFLVSWHQHNTPTKTSFLEPRHQDGDRRSRSRHVIRTILLGPFAFLVYRDNPMVLFHSALIVANIAIIVGGSFLAGSDYTDPTSPDTLRRMNVAKITRTAGQSVFLACNFLLLGAILLTIRNNVRDGDSSSRRKGRVHPTLVVLLIAWFPLIARGVFGVLQSAVWGLSYFNHDNYDADGFTARFTAIEYILGVLTEFLAAVLLNFTYFTSRNDQSKRDVPTSLKEVESY